MSRTDAPYRDAARYDAEMSRAYAEQDGFDAEVETVVNEMLTNAVDLEATVYADVGLGTPENDELARAHAIWAAASARNHLMPASVRDALRKRLLPAARERIERRAAAREAA